MAENRCSIFHTDHPVSELGLSHPYSSLGPRAAPTHSKACSDAPTVHRFLHFLTDFFGVLGRIGKLIVPLFVCLPHRAEQLEGM